MTNNPLEIRWVEHGVANRFSDCIEIHEDLKNYPELLNPIIAHEHGHSDKAFSIKDFLHDVSTDNVSPFKLWGFMLSRPSTWSQFLPLYKHPQRGWIYDINCGIIWVGILLLLGLDIYLMASIF